MKRKLKIGMAAAVALGGLALWTPQTWAMPASGITTAIAKSAAEGAIDNVRYVCGPYRCWWRPDYYDYYDEGPAPFIGGFFGGWDGGWEHRRHHHWDEDWRRHHH